MRGWKVPNVSRRDWFAPATRWSAHFLEVRQLPALVEHGLAGAVEAEERKPILPRSRVHPVRLAAAWSFGAEREVDGPVCVPPQTLEGIDADALGARLESGGLRVVDRGRPVLVGRHARWDVQAIRGVAVQ